MPYENERQCPHLGGKARRDGHVDYPSSRNVCFAKVTYKKSLLRLIAYPYSVVPSKQQRDLCLWAYSKCPIYQRQESKLVQT